MYCYVLCVGEVPVGRERQRVWNDAKAEADLRGHHLVCVLCAVCCVLCRQDTQEDYEQHVVPLLQKYPQVREHKKAACAAVYSPSDRHL